mmetsp:Transcript_27633/g.57898  ORF Transcript_27633/g.57898 Transcript_27633/m.57898 type:complete len:86 (-) Transcript_27633:144-401(-)
MLDEVQRSRMQEIFVEISYRAPIRRLYLDPQMRRRQTEFGPISRKTFFLMVDMPLMTTISECSKVCTLSHHKQTKDINFIFIDVM